jgi:hypothetical protein
LRPRAHMRQLNRPGMSAVLIGRVYQAQSHCDREMAVVAKPQQRFPPAGMRGIGEC